MPTSPLPPLLCKDTTTKPRVNLGNLELQAQASQRLSPLNVQMGSHQFGVLQHSIYTKTI